MKKDEINLLNMYRLIVCGDKRTYLIAKVLLKI